PLKPHFRCGNQENAHVRSVRENLGAIEDGIVKRDRKDPKAERARPVEQFMRGIIERVLGIVEGMDMEIDLDPVFGFRHWAICEVVPRESTSLLFPAHDPDLAPDLSGKIRIMIKNRSMKGVGKQDLRPAIFHLPS